MSRVIRRVATSASYRWRLVETRLRHGGRRPPICADVGSWAATHQDVRPTELFPPRVVRRRPPRTVEPEILDGYIEQVELQGRYVVPVRGARIVGREGVVLLPDGSYSAESMLGAPNLVERVDYYAPLRRPTVEKPGDYFALLDFLTHGHYYHWMHDRLTSLYGIREHLPPGTKFVIAPRPTLLQQETLRIVGVADDELVELDPSEVWRVETLHFASPPTLSGAHRPEIDLWLRDLILGSYGITPGRTGRRIFISRNQLKYRRVVNEAALLELLDGYGFESCTPEAMSLREQAETFAGAEIVVSTHGSAFTNMLFSAPGLRILDMVSPSMFTNAFAFWSMAEALDHEYWYLVADDVPVADRDQPDVHVALDKVAATFDRMGLEPVP